MRVRELTSDDYVAYRTMTSGAFGGSFPEAQEKESRPFADGEIPLGIDSSQLPGGVDGVIAAGARIRRDRVALGGGVVRCGGIGGLAVHPAHRGGGLFGALLTGVIARCDAEDMPLSMLYPSNPSIYRRFGYQVVASVPTVIIPLMDLQRMPAVAGRRLVPVTAETVPRLHALYRELSAGDNGMLRREPPLFATGMPGGGWSALLLEDVDGLDHGYISWTRLDEDAQGAGLDVHEVFGRTRDDRIALLRSLGSWSTVTERARLRVRTEDPVLDALPGGGLRPDPGTLPLVMMRVIDTAAALEARRAPVGLSGSVHLVVEDRTVPAGTCRSAGRWIVSAADGRITVAAQKSDGGGGGDDGRGGAGAEGPLGTARLDVHAASLLLTGGRTLADARRLDLVATADPSAEFFLDALLAGPRPSVMDAF
ncbi:enhanced intracellular survival protein Eis [Brachybacterium sp. FME24]|uniref:GNAT family N-acetyltransferase n=1 Tax=Brachybacterium sp. FME24 TaxID=2742605 RepID=UPI001865CD35|nr:GNAT family N-acetyltransferase [Brachybacterium sp. FME24]